MISKLFSLLFLVLLFGPAMLWGQRYLNNYELEIKSSYENRLKYEYPSSLSFWSEPKKFMNKFSLFHDDHLPLRDDLLSLNTKLHYHLFKASTSNQILVGKNRWLFYNNETSIASYKKPSKRFRDSAKIWKNVVSRKTKLQKKRGKEYALIIAPNKSSIYPEYVPEKYKRNSKNARINHLMSLFEDTDYKVINLRGPLEEAKNIGRLYHKTDTHWTELGAKIALDNIFAKLSVPNPGPTGADQAGTDQTSAGENELEEFTGDLAIIWGAGEWYMESKVKESPKAACQHRKLINHKFEKGAELKVSNYNCKNGKLNVLLFADSFGVAITPLLAKSVGTLNSVKRFPSFYEYNFLVEKYQPDLVLELYVERSLHGTSRKGLFLGKEESP